MSKEHEVEHQTYRNAVKTTCWETKLHKGGIVADARKRIEVKLEEGKIFYPKEIADILHDNSSFNG